MSGMIWRLSFSRAREAGNQIARDSGDFHSLRAALFFGDDSNSGNWDIQTLGQQPAQGVVRAIFDGGRGRANFQCAV
jgi:hypothetical protein